MYKMFSNSLKISNEDDSRPSNMDLIECAQVFYTCSGKFVYDCTFCEKQYQSNEELISHLTLEHLNKQVDELQSLKNQELSLDNNKIERDGEPDPEMLIPYSPKTSNASESPSEIDDTIQLDTCQFGVTTKLLIEPITDESDLTDYFEEKPETKTSLSSIFVSNNIDEFLDTDTVLVKHGVIIHQCSYCIKQFTRKTDFDEHRKTHENSKEIICQHAKCSRTFASTSAYHHHMAIHRKGKQHQCNVCSKKFNYMCNLKTHVRRHHTLKKPFACLHCDKRFFTSSEKLLHETIHTGTKPFVCEVCGLEFLTNSRLKTHRISHEQLLKYPCKQCNEVFSSPKDQWEHSLTHKIKKKIDSFICEQPSKDYILPRSHLRKNETIKYLCTFCNQAFEQNSALHFHMKTHDEE